MPQDVAFVGGAALAFYIGDPTIDDVRATDDVDCVVEATTLLARTTVDKQLRARGFREDASSKVICRWRLGNTIVDVMPTSPDVLGFVNSWYREGWRLREVRSLPSGLEICVFPFALFFASKLEAFMQRGVHDWLASKDLEDLVALLDGHGGAVEQLRASPPAVTTYLRETCGRLFLVPDQLAEAIGGHLLPADSTPERIALVLSRFEAIC